MLDVAVVGAGPGGAAAANGIRRAAPQLKVKVFERAPVLRRVGFTVVITGNGLSAIEAIDPACLQAVDRCCLPDGPIVRLNVDGEEISRTPSPAVAYAPAKVAFVPWYQVQKSLLDFLPPGTLELGHSLQNVDVGSDGVTLQFHDKPEVRAKLVIGADGNQSGVRQALLGDGPPQFSNTAVWRGQTLQPAAWPYLDNRSTSFVGRAVGSGISTIRFGDGYMAWTVFLPFGPERLAELGSGRYIESAPGAHTAAGSKLERCLATAGAEWPSAVLDLIRSTDSSTVTEHGVFYREPEACRVWGKGPISLLGDAAHLATPFLGQGVNQALEDAAELGRAIGRHGATEEALREYERARLPRSQKVQAGSVAMLKAVRRGEAGVSEAQWHRDNLWCIQHKPEPLVGPRAV